MVYERVTESAYIIFCIEHRHFTFLRAKFAGRKTSGTIENNVLVHGGICGDLLSGIETMSGESKNIFIGIGKKDGTKTLLSLC